MEEMEEQGITVVPLSELLNLPPSYPPTTVDSREERERERERGYKGERGGCPSSAGAKKRRRRNLKERCGRSFCEEGRREGGRLPKQRWRRRRGEGGRERAWRGGRRGVSSSKKEFGEAAAASFSLGQSRIGGGGGGGERTERPSLSSFPHFPFSLEGSVQLEALRDGQGRREERERCERATLSLLSPSFPLMPTGVCGRERRRRRRRRRRRQKLCRFKERGERKEKEEEGLKWNGPSPQTFQMEILGKEGRKKYEFGLHNVVVVQARGPQKGSRGSNWN